MDSKFKLDMLKDEFCIKGELQGYKSELDAIFDRISNSNCRISACDTCENSSIEQSLEGDIVSHIRISFKTKRTKPIRCIWDILHEFGHHLSGKPNNREKSIEREQEAWAIGLEILREYEILKYAEEDYLIYQEECLNSYREFARIVNSKGANSY